jgi:hypothetical protein
LTDSHLTDNHKTDKLKLKIKQDVSSKSNWLGNVPLIEKPTSPIVLFVWHLEDNKTYDFLQDDPQTLS